MCSRPGCSSAVYLTSGGWECTDREQRVQPTQWMTDSSSSVDDIKAQLARRVDVAKAIDSMLYRWSVGLSRWKMESKGEDREFTHGEVG